MKKLFLIFLFLLFAFPAWAGTYYMRADGTAANKGAATGPCGTVGNCMSIATHNADTFSGDDIIYLCDDGGDYRDKMDIPSSGTSGHVITYTAASGDTPIIKGSDIISTWTGVTAYEIKETFGDPSDDYYPSGYAVWYANRFTPASSYTLTRVGVTLKKGGGTPCSNPLTGYIYSDNGSGTPDAAIGTAIATIQPTLTTSYVYYYFDFAGVALTNGTIYWVVIKTPLDETNYMFVGEDAGGASGIFCKKSLNAVDWLTGDTNAQPTVRTYITGSTTVWQAALATEPDVVWFDGEIGTKETSIVNLDAAKEWYWTGNVLYVYSATDPDTAYTDPGVEATQRNVCISSNGQNYLVFDNLAIRHAGTADGAGLSVNGGSDSITISNCDFSENAYKHIGLWGAVPISTTYTIDGCTFSYSGRSKAATNESAIDCDSTAADDFNVIVQNSSFTQIAGYTGSGYHSHGIYHKNGTLTFRYNIVSNGGTETGAGVKISTGTSNGCNIYDNIFTNGGGTQVWGVFSEAGSGHNVYNNVFYTVTTGVWHATGGTGINIKNNIFHSSASSIFLRAQSSTNFVSDYNSFYNGATKPFYWEATTYNLADWKTTSSQDTNSLSSDPLFVSTGTDFHLQIASPCRDAGINVGLTQDYEGNTVPNRGVPDIGAYEYLFIQPSIPCEGWWPFYLYGSEQYKIWDISGNQKHGTIHNVAPAIYELSPTGYEGLGWRFNGKTSYVNHSVIDLGKNNTVHYWIKTATETSTTVHGGAENYGIRISDTTVGYNAGTGNTVAVSHNGAFSIAQKTLISVRRTGTKVNFYQDGLQIGTEQTLPADNNLYLTDIGRDSDDATFPFDGVMFEAKVLNIDEGFVGVRNYFETTRSNPGI